MNRVFPAETAVFFHLKPIGIVLPVLHRIIVPLPAIIASQRNTYTHRTTLLYNYNSTINLNK